MVKWFRSPCYEKGCYPGPKIKNCLFGVGDRLTSFGQIDFFSAKNKKIIFSQYDLIW